jgi:hypothetical protein
VLPISFRWCRFCSLTLVDTRFEITIRCLGTGLGRRRVGGGLEPLGEHS